MQPGRNNCDNGSHDAAKSLTARQQLFVFEYLKDLNATRAAIRAGYSRRTAPAAASRLLTNVKVAAEIYQASEKRAKRLEFDADRILKEIAKVAFANIGDYVEVQVDGSLRFDFLTLDRNTAASIGQLAIDEHIEGKVKNARTVRKIRFKLFDKLRALELLGKHIGLFKEKQENGFGLDSRSCQEISKALGLDKASDEVLDFIISQAKRTDS